MKEFLIGLALGRKEIPRKFMPLYEQIKCCGALEKHGAKHDTKYDKALESSYLESSGEDDARDANAKTAKYSKHSKSARAQKHQKYHKYQEKARDKYQKSSAQDSSQAQMSAESSHTKHTPNYHAQNQAAPNHSQPPSKHAYKLSDKFIIAQIIIHNHRIFAKNIAKPNDKDLLLKGRYGNLKDGDIALLLSITRAPKLIKILSSSASTPRLVYLERKKGAIVGIDCKTLESTRLPFSQKSLLELPKHCVLALENGKIKQILGSLDDPSIDERISLFLSQRAEDFGEEAKELARNFGAQVEPSLYLAPKNLDSAFLSHTNHAGAESKNQARKKSPKNAESTSHTNYTSPAKSTSPAHSSAPYRRDLRALDFITIDPIDAKDHDDAVFWDMHAHTLYVAIADVSEYVTPHTPLDDEAKARGFSLYFPHKCYPMLPRELSESLCSLRRDEVKLALVWEIRLHKRTKLPIKAQLYEALITPKANISYEAVDKILESSAKMDSSEKVDSGVADSGAKADSGGCADFGVADSHAKIDSSKKLDSAMPYAIWIRDLARVTQTLKTKRLEKGYDFSTREMKLHLDKNSELESISTHKSTPSHSLIEESMLLANILSAQCLATALNGAGIYRTHEAPMKERIHALFADISELGYTIPKGKLHAQIQALQKEADRRDKKALAEKKVVVEKNAAEKNAQIHKSRASENKGRENQASKNLDSARDLESTHDLDSRDANSRALESTESASSLDSANLDSALDSASDFTHDLSSCDADSCDLNSVPESTNALDSTAALSHRELLDRLIIRAQKEARYSDEVALHFGLGFETYTHFTSPIRRYSDIIAHRLLKVLLANTPIELKPESPHIAPLATKHAKQIAYILESSSAIIPMLNTKERAIAKTEMDFKDRKYARAACKHIGRALRVRVIDERYPAICVAESLIFGARIFVEDSRRELERHGIYQARLTRAELANGRIFAEIE